MRKTALSLLFFYLLLHGVVAEAEEAEADSTQIARPSFSMTPT